MWLVTGERSTSRNKGLIRPLVVVSIASLLMSACGSSSSSPTTTASNSPAAAAFKYASCMRKHGVASYPDPQVTTNPGGSVAVAIAGQSGPVRRQLSGPRRRHAAGSCPRPAAATGRQDRRRRCSWRSRTASTLTASQTSRTPTPKDG